jgi:hypothetical protein
MGQLLLAPGAEGRRLLEAMAKPQTSTSDHSERSEESIVIKKFYIIHFVQDDRKV